MASVETVNRYSALEMDDEGNFITKKAPKKSEEKTQQQPQQPQKEQNHEAKERVRVSDRNRRGGRGGGGAAGGPGEVRARGGRGGGAPHRGGYISEGNKREFDRRGAPSDRPRGRARKGGVGLGRYGEDNEFGGVRRNRPHRQDFDPSVAGSEAEAVAESAGDATTDAAAAAPVTEATETTDASGAAAESTPDAATAEAAAVEVVPTVEEEVDTSLTFDEYQAQIKAKAVEDDVKRQLREVQINDKQWKKVNESGGIKKKKTTLTVSGQEVEVEEDQKPATERSEKKKKVLSLDEFVGHPSDVKSSAPQQPRSESSRGRGGRGGQGAERGGRGGGSEFRGRGRGGRGRGGFRIDDKTAFPDLGAPVKKQ